MLYVMLCHVKRGNKLLQTVGLLQVDFVKDWMAAASPLRSA